MLRVYAGETMTNPDQDLPTDEELAELERMIKGE